MLAKVSMARLSCQDWMLVQISLRRCLLKVLVCLDHPILLLWL